MCSAWVTVWAVMSWQRKDTDFRIVGGSENDELAKNHFEKRTGAKDFGTLEELHAKLQQGLDLGPVHVMAG